jgi:ABC-type proline/glycine betaine transport system ATPase subunit
MEQQDYLKRQIDQMAKVLGKIIADITGLKDQGKVNEGMEIADQTMKSELALDMGDLLKIPKNEFIDTLLNKKQVHYENLEQFAEMLSELADGWLKQDDNEKAKGLYEKTLAIYEYLEETGSAFSFARNMKKQQINSILQGL